MCVFLGHPGHVHIYLIETLKNTEQSLSLQLKIEQCELGFPADVGK